jgi:Uma2 family endonuclease
VSVRTKRWNRAEYDRAVAAGAFAPDAHVQLIQGDIVEMTPQGAAHVAAVRAVEEALRSMFSTGYDVRVQAPLALLSDSEPEPDVAVVPGSFRDYRDHHPDRAVLVVEVADTSLMFDRTSKAAVYAGADIREYWIVNLVDHQLEVYRDPRNGAYATHDVLSASDVITPVAAPGAQLAVADICR